MRSPRCSCSIASTPAVRLTALEDAGSAVHGLLRRTAEAGSREILTVAAQDEFVAPATRFVAHPC